MADSYVCSGATMKCSMGTSQAKLTVLPSRTVFLTGQPMANISDHLSMVNLAPFGRCRSLGFPATASATAANHGTLTPMPCMHNTPFPWMGGKNDYIVKGDPALLKSSTCQCMWGGTISLVTDGQKDTGPADMTKTLTEEFEKDQVKADGLNAEDVLDGIQMALDVAGMVPLAGAIPDLANAAISALRGNWFDAGMSLLAAVPGAGDAVGGAKLVKNGVKIAQKTKLAKVEKTAETSGKISREQLAKTRAKKMGVEYDPNCSQILYDTAPNQKQGKLLKLTEKSSSGSKESRNLPNIEINPNAENNPFSNGYMTSKHSDKFSSNNHEGNSEIIAKGKTEVNNSKSLKHQIESEEKKLQSTKDALKKEENKTNTKEWIG